jgi:HJR/Mrr/RecB family endonuclease
MVGEGAEKVRKMGEKVVDDGTSYSRQKNSDIFDIFKGIKDLPIYPDFLLKSVLEEVEIVNKTTVASDFFNGYARIICYLEELVKLEKRTKFKNGLPSLDLMKIKNTQEDSINAFIERTYAKATSMAVELKTSDEKKETFDLLFGNISLYKKDMLEPNIRRYNELNDKFFRSLQYFIRQEELLKVASSDLAKVTDGYQFEAYIAELLKNNGFCNVEITLKSGDYGIDVLADKNEIKYAIQCKLYSSPVGVGAIQEAIAGKTYYNAHVAIVATNNVFTANAKTLADKVGVVLWDIQTIADMGGVMSKKPLSPFEIDISETSPLVAAYDVVQMAGYANASLLQHRLRVDYLQACELLDEMENKGIISASNGSQSRSILITEEQWENMKAELIFSNIDINDTKDDKLIQNDLGDI